ncbi:hypothetical protein FB451DRAFT_1359892 [Mycena latifolia]|nr:hypothetical protein FB451DRAFT_1359892 [Mycena latifolia]
MTQGTNPPNSASGSNPSGPQSVPPPPARTRKTHITQIVSDALKKLPKHIKLKKNQEIEDRNALRTVKAVQHASDPVKYPDPASDEESIITTSDAGDVLSPASTGKNLLRSLPMFAKRKLDKEEKPAAAKKICLDLPEVTIQPGMSLPVVFHPYLKDLLYYRVYIPLSMFTSPNLDIINSTSATIDTIKLNPANPGEKPFQVINTDLFKAKYLREGDLDRGQWQEAARNFVTFIEEVHGVDSEQGKRWNTHFGYFANAEHAEKNYLAILSADMDLQRKYNTHPFTYDRTHYGRQLDLHVQNINLSNLEKRLGGKSGAGSGEPPRAPRAPPSQHGGGRGGRGGRGGSRGGPPFQGGNGGEPPATVCLVCGRRGHYFDACTSTTFADNSPVFSSVRDRDLLAIRSGQTLCRIWNVKGERAGCTHDTTTRAHSCSFCGKSHHAFSWSCRQNPPL